MRTRTWCVAATLVSIARFVAAQSVLSEADALARLSEESPRVRAIRASVDVVRADAIAAGRWPNPRLTYNREAVAGVTEHMFLFTQPVPISGRRGLDVDAASALVQVSQLRADQEIRQLRAALRNAYADLVSGQVRESQIEVSRDRLRGLAEILGRRETAGESAGYDRLRAEREVLDLEADWAAARADRARAQAALAEFFAPATDIAGLVAVAPDRSAGVELPTVDELVAHAEKTLPEIAALKQEIESADFAAHAAARRPIPDPEIVLGTKSSNLGGGDVGGVLSIHASLPLFDRSMAEKTLAQAHRLQAEARLAALQASLRAHMLALRAAVLERRQAAERYRTGTTASATELERIAQVSYDAGERGILELLDAYRNSGAARARQPLLDAAVRHAEIELELASGWEIR